jgi:polyphosphate kinase 2 (PPK2 family)
MIFQYLATRKFYMNTRPPFEHDELLRRISRDLADGYDEELEMEIEDRHPLPGVSSAVESDAEKDYRRTYFQQLFRLQAELVKLQDWVVASGQKVLILFEGRDAAGKGGAIKRISQKLNPRVCRVVALPAPNDRERTQWYFQRYVSHLPAAGEMVLFDHSWYKNPQQPLAHRFGQPSTALLGRSVPLSASLCHCPSLFS